MSIFHRAVTFARWRLNETKDNLRLLIFWIIAVGFEVALPLVRIRHTMRARSTKMHKLVTIFGWYGFETIGDAAVLAAIVHELSTEIGAQAKFSIISYDLPHTMRMLNDLTLEKEVDVVEGKKNSLKLIRRSDLIIIGGGPLLEDNIMFDWLKKVICAKAFNKPVAIYGCGVGPILTNPIKRAVRMIANISDIVTVRDAQSEEQLRSLKVRNKILVTADPSVAFPGLFIPTSASAIRSAKPTVCVSLRQRADPQPLPPNFTRTIARVLDKVTKEKDARIVFLNLQTHPHDDDRVIDAEVFRLMSEKDAVIDYMNQRSLSEIIHVLEGAELLIGMRLHALIFAAAKGVPTIGLGMTNGKLSAFLKAIHQEDCFLDIREVTEEALLEKIHKVWLDERRKQIILVGMNRLKDLSRVGSNIISKLLWPNYSEILPSLALPRISLSSDRELCS